MKRLLFLCCLLFALPADGQNAGLVFNAISWEDALIKAKSENKPVFIEIVSKNCHICKLMEAEVLSLKETGDFYTSNFINLKITAETDSSGLADKYHVNAYPAYLYFSPEGDIVNRDMGYVESPLLIDMGKKALVYSKAAMAGKLKNNSALTEELSKLKGKDDGLTKDVATLIYFEHYGDWNKYAVETDNLMRNNFIDDVFLLNHIAGNFSKYITDVNQLASVEKWLKKSRIKDNYTTALYTAIILQKLGKKEEALKMSKLALSIAREQLLQAKEAEELLKRLE